MPQQASNTENRTVPIRKPNSELRSREYLTVKEVERLMEAARKNRRGHRDATMILLAFRHGLRPSEVCALKWEQFDLGQGTVHINRLLCPLSRFRGAVVCSRTFFLMGDLV